MAFDVDMSDLQNNIPQYAWEMVAPNITHDDTFTHLQGFSTLQHEQTEQEDTIDTIATSEAKEINCQCCMQKQLKDKT